MRLLGRPADDFDRQRGAAGAYLRGIIMNAVKAVRASYAKPGEATRDRRTREQPQQDVVITDAPIEMPEDDDATVSHNVADETVTPERIEATIDAKSVLMDLAPPPVARALYLVHVAGETWQTAAKEVGMSRHQLARRVDHFTTRLAKAHAAIAA